MTPICSFTARLFYRMVPDNCSAKPAPVKILMLGGTAFMGFFLTEELVKGGHDVTLLHRGNTAPSGVPGARNLVGNREVSGILQRASSYYQPSGNYCVRQTWVGRSFRLDGRPKIYVAHPSSNQKIAADEALKRLAQRKPAQKEEVQ